MKSDKKTMVSVDNVTKTFKLPHNRKTSIKEYFISPFSRSTVEDQKALKDISFKISEGEFLGIIGRNGSGKSTLLKVLAGVYVPNKGEVGIHGSLVPFIELGVGFNHELTGKENVYLNGALIGFSRKEISNMYEDIVAFAELEDFMDQKLKNYSSGMQVRLAFSIAIRAKSDILLLDEVLAVGDSNFQQKCFDYFNTLKRDKRTIILVSHDMNAIQNYCDRALLINKGSIIKDGNPKEVVSEYRKMNHVSSDDNEETTDQDGQDDVFRWGSNSADIKSVAIGGYSKGGRSFLPEDNIEVSLKFKAKESILNPVVGIQIDSADGKIVFAGNTKEVKLLKNSYKAGEDISVKFSIDNVYNDGLYTVSCALHDPRNPTPYVRAENIKKFRVSGRVMRQSLIHPRHRVTKG